MAKDLRFSLLLAFYRNLLSDNQVEMLESYYDHDLSLSEISENVGMSRQGVRDTIKRAEQQLSEYEEKLGFMKRTLKQEEQIVNVLQELTKIQTQFTDKQIAQILEHVKAELNCLV